MKRVFLNNTEAGFYDYTMAHGNYKESTVWHYIQRMRQIESMDTLVKKDLDVVIADYITGAHKEMNKTCHNAYSCALKRLQTYQGAMIARGTVVI